MGVLLRWRTEWPSALYTDGRAKLFRLEAPSDLCNPSVNSGAGKRPLANYLIITISSSQNNRVLVDSGPPLLYITAVPLGFHVARS